MKEPQKTQPNTPDEGSRYRKDAIPLYSDEAGRLYRDKARTQVADQKIVRTPRRGGQVYWVKPIPESGRVHALRRDLAESPSARLRELTASGDMPVRVGAKAATKIEAERAAVEAELAAAPGHRPSAPRVDFTKVDKATHLPEADVDELRAFVSHFVERVVVRRPPHRRPQPEERAEIVWRRPEIMLDSVFGTEA
jgi:hypothetical protein